MKKLLKNFLKTVLFHGYFPLVYKWHARKPIEKNSVLFIEIRYDTLTNNFRLLWDALQQRKDCDIDAVFFGNSVYAYKTYLGRCLDMLKKLARAEFVLVDESSNVLAALPIRPETKMIQVWHGCGAFKRFGHGIEDGLKEPYYNPYAFVTVSSSQVVDIYATSMRQKEEVILPIGVSRTDVFFSKDYVRNSTQSVRNRYTIPHDKKVVLYAPTFRGNVQKAMAPRMLDYKKLYEDLGDSYVILYKGHPSVRADVVIEEPYREFFVDASDESIEELMCAADLCITDYSSLVFEYALLERPILFYAYDYKEYVTERGFYYNYEEFVPGPICYSEEELIQCIKTIQYDKNYQEELLHRVDEFKMRFMAACDGKSTDRILKRMFEKD